MRSRERTARRYAKALYDVAREAGATEAVGKELDQLAATFAAAAAARDVLTRPWIKPADRRGVAVAIAQKLGARKLVQDFAGLVAERGRADHLPEILAAYRILLDAEFGRARAQVRTAVALTDAEKQQLSGKLERALGKRIILEEQVDATLLGGFIAQVGSLILDGSLDGQLARLRQRLARG
ncbi:MAG TPA: ATP synthase F1 subunit delta [Methylomirabilota bacterium]|nr:ATP synthase F1 subunit delta [Methylomirabilota bacterium]